MLCGVSCRLLPAKPIGSHLLGVSSYPKPDSQGHPMGPLGRRENRLFWNILAVCLWAASSPFGCCSAGLPGTVLFRPRRPAACTCAVPSYMFSPTGRHTVTRRNHVAASHGCARERPGATALAAQPLMWRWGCVGLAPQAALKAYGPGHEAVLGPQPGGHSQGQEEGRGRKLSSWPRVLTLHSCPGLY